MAGKQTLGNLQTLKAAADGVVSFVSSILDQDELGRLVHYAYAVAKDTPDILSCTLESFQSALVKCAQLRLVPDVRGHAYIIPRRTGPKVAGSKQFEAHFQLGYQGMLELARRSGKVLVIEARVVYDGDEFDFEYGTTPYVKHKPSDTAAKDRSSLRYAYCIAELAGATRPQFVVVDRIDIAQIPESQIPVNVQASDRRFYSPWNRHTAAMWMKTAAKRLANWLPASVELQQAVALDTLTEINRSQMPHMAYAKLPHTGDARSLDDYQQGDAENAGDEERPPSEEGDGDDQS